jgi:hypothetical protein
MRKAAAALMILLALASISAMAQVSPPEPSSEHTSLPASLFAQGGGPGAAGFSLAGSASPVSSIGLPSLDLQDRPEPLIAEKPLEVPAPGLKSDPDAPRLTVSFFIGPKGGDVFSSLHKAYAWKPMSRSLTLGLGLYREIPIHRGIGLLPYVGIIRASATLSLAGHNGNRDSIEYRLTAFCIGLPLVVRFN